MTRLLSSAPLLAAFFLAGCPMDMDSGDKDTGGADTDTGGETGETGTTTYNVTGTAVDFPTFAPLGAGACVVAVDPTPAMEPGGEPTVLASTTTAADGTYTLSAIAEKPAVGLVIIVQDCATEGLIFPTGTGVKADLVDALGDGETLPDQMSFALSATVIVGMEDSFGAAGGSWDSATEGLMMGFVFDSVGTPLSGATVEGVGATTYYLDTDTADGMFTNVSTGVNSSTNAAAGAVFAIPDAPITSYLATADTYTFATITAGSIPGIALFVAFFAD